MVGPATSSDAQIRKILAGDLPADGAQADHRVPTRRTFYVDLRHHRAQHTLYRLFNAAGELLYIGLSYDVHRRFWDHSRDKAWWGDVADYQLETYPSHDALTNAERVAIRRENPLHNKRRDRKRPLRKRVSADMWDWMHYLGDYADTAHTELPADAYEIRDRHGLTAAERIWLHRND